MLDRHRDEVIWGSSALANGHQGMSTRAIGLHAIAGSKAGGGAGDCGDKVMQAAVTGGTSDPVSRKLSALALFSVPQLQCSTGFARADSIFTAAL